MSISDPRAFLTELFNVAVRASVPEVVLPAHMPKPPKGRTIVVGAGKASAQMTAAFEKAVENSPDWNSPVSGLVVTQYGAAEACQFVEIVEAAHPVPDDAGEVAAARMIEIVSGAGVDDLVVALISGGGSSLLCLPADGLTLKDKQHINSSLLASGAPISAMNSIRKMFSKVKGGRLGAAAHPAKLLSLVISDVPGDEVAKVASGPTIASAGEAVEARMLVEKYNVDLPNGAMKILGLNNSPPPSSEDPRFDGANYQVIASAMLSLNAAAEQARNMGCEVILLSDAIEGEALEIGSEHGRLLKEKLMERKTQKPLLILSGGETVVSIEGGLSNAGKGGRNSAYLLALAMEIEGANGVCCLAADTDGRDGSEDNAGAFCDGTSVERMKKVDIIAREYLAKHDSWSAFDGVNDLLICGPTGTNVNDFRALLIL